MPIYTTLPGDISSLESQGFGEGLPIWRRFAVLIRSRRIDIAEVMRGYDPVDRGFFEQNQFRRALCDCCGHQWTELAMTSAEFHEIASPYFTKVSQVPGAPCVSGEKETPRDPFPLARARPGRGASHRARGFARRPPMVQWRHFARDMQKVADDLLTDKDIAAAERLDGTNTADINNTRNDGYFKARADKGEKEGTDMSPDGRKLKVRQSAAALASGLLEYEDVPDADGDGKMDKAAYRGERGAGEMSAASQLFGWGR